MNWDEIEANWTLLHGHVRQNWARLTDDDVTQIDGDRDALIRCLKGRYNFPKDQAERQAEAWAYSLTRFRAA